MRKKGFGKSEKIIFSSLPVFSPFTLRVLLASPLTRARARARGAELPIAAKRTVGVTAQLRAFAKHNNEQQSNTTSYDLVMLGRCAQACLGSMPANGGGEGGSLLPGATSPGVPRSCTRAERAGYVLSTFSPPPCERVNAGAQTLRGLSVSMRAGYSNAESKGGESRACFCFE